MKNCKLCPNPRKFFDAVPVPVLLLPAGLLNYVEPDFA